MLGSIIFTLQIPISGLVIGSCAIVLISLIAVYGHGRGSIIKATMIVAIFKMMLTPQAPPTAYLAVFFQGLMGELLFWRKNYYRVACILLAVIALIESAAQKILTATIIYGKDFWTALNQFVHKLTGQTEVTNFSYFIIFWYVMIHVIVGLLIGLWAGSLPGKIKNMNSAFKKYLFDFSEANTIQPNIRKKKKLFRFSLLIVWIVLLALYIQSFFHIGAPLLPQNQVLKILIRSFVIVLTWYFLISPALKQLLSKWLQKKKQQSAAQFQQVLNILPATQRMVVQSWSVSAEKSGIRRVQLFSKIVLANTFNVPQTKQ